MEEIDFCIVQLSKNRRLINGKLVPEYAQQKSGWIVTFPEVSRNLLLIIKLQSISQITYITCVQKTLLQAHPT